MGRSNMKRKILSGFLIALLSAFFLEGLLTGGSRVYAANFENETTKGKVSENIHTQNYEDDWFHPVKSYLYREENGNYNRVECIGSYIYSEIYGADYKYISRKKIKLELARFGGIYITKDAYFVLLGQDNKKAKPGVTEFRIIKYDKNWNKLASKDLKDANTCYPFDFGSCRFAEKDGFLYIRTCHEMYDGHQASVMLKVNMSDCSIITANYDVANSSYGYISHSFNEFLDSKNGMVYACDHGDAYERGVTVMRYDNLAPGTDTFDNDVTGVVAMPFVGEEGDNYTGATLGGFAVSDTHAIAVGSSVPQKKGSGYDSVYNIYTVAVSTSNFDESGTAVNWITNYSQKGKWSVTNPQMVEINSNRYLVMWEEEKNGKFERMRYVFIDGTGKKVSDIRSIAAPLSECQPVVSGDSVVWYVTDGSSPVFYQLPLDGTDVPAAKVRTKFTKNGITYQVKKSSKTAGKVSVAGYNKREMPKSVKIPSKVMYNGYSYSVTAIAPKAFRKCTKIKSVYIPSPVTSIGKQAFYKCTNMRSVIMLSSVTSIGKQAFEGCKKLGWLEVKYKKYTTKNVGKNAFKGVPRKVVVCVPAKKGKAYKKLFIKRGIKPGTRFELR